MVSKGLATVIRYRQDDDQRASCYDDLLSAEAKATKSNKGLHNKKETPIHRVADLSSVSVFVCLSLAIMRSAVLGMFSLRLTEA